MKLYILIYFLSIITVSLMAGLFFNWSFNITSGLAALDDKNYLTAMQSLNRSILNPAFFFIFLGSIIAPPILTFLQSKIVVDSAFYFILAAMIIYLLGSIAVTFFGNVPLNNQLEILDITQLSLEECKDFRETFERRWNRLNLIRTASSFIATLLLLIPLFMHLSRKLPSS